MRGDDVMPTKFGAGGKREIRHEDSKIRNENTEITVLAHHKYGHEGLPQLSLHHPCLPILLVRLYR